MHRDVSRSSLRGHVQKCKHLIKSICHVWMQPLQRLFLSSYFLKEIMRNIVEQVSLFSWFCNAIARHVKRVKHFTLQDMCSVCSVNLAITSQGVSKNAGHHRITIRDMCLEAQHGTVGKHNLHTIQNESLWYISIYILTHPAHESLPFIWLTLGVKVTPARHCKGVLWSYDVLWKVCRNPWATLCLIALGSSVQGHNNSFQIVEGHINGLKHSHNISKYYKICQNSKYQMCINIINIKALQNCDTLGKSKEFALASWRSLPFTPVWDTWQLHRTLPGKLGHGTVQPLSSAKL